MVSNNSSGGKNLRLPLFIVQATRGLVRDRNTRRNLMFALIVSAIVLVFAGSTFLQAPLNPGEHPLGFLLFWIVCGWLTLAALLLGIFDLLMVKSEARKAERSLREECAQSDNSRRSTTRAFGSEHTNRFGVHKQSRLGK
jgi:hypothetical protein